MVLLPGAFGSEELDVYVSHGGAQDGLFADGLVGHLRTGRWSDRSGSGLSFGCGLVGWCQSQVRRD